MASTVIMTPVPLDKMDAFTMLIQAYYMGFMAAREENPLKVEDI